jgi:hypothetical protein
MRTQKVRRNHGQRPGDGRPKRGRARQLNLLLETVEQERANLSRVESLLECLRISMEYESQTATGPYYPDVAQIAHELVRKSVNALDPINLPSMTRGKVREEFLPGHFAQLSMQFQCMSGVQGTGEASTALLASAALVSLPNARLPRMFVRKLRMRLHRRNYSRDSVSRSPSSASSPCSAAVKMSG